MTRGPVLIDLSDTDIANPAIAPAVHDNASGSQSTMQHVAAIAARKPSRLARWFWAVSITFTGFVFSLAAWDYINGLITRSPILGGIASFLIALMICVMTIMALREFFAIRRLRKLDGIQQQAKAALDNADMTQARQVIAALDTLYKNRSDTAWGRAELHARQSEVMDANALLGLAELHLLAPLDARAQTEVEAAARHVATVTALVPIALADLFTALVTNLRMIRKIAEIYGGRAGTLGSWRLTRSILTHLVATGAVAVGDDLIGSVAGGSVVSKLSRRFGEGIVNGALTVRVGVAAMEVCRPLPFCGAHKPSVSRLLGRALTGLFGRSKSK